MSFLNKVVIVTGSGTGIGAATAILFAEEKANVVIVGRRVEKLNKVRDEIKKIHGIEPLIVVADVSKDDQARGIIDKTIKHFGKLDVLVNNAGIVAVKSILDDDYIKDFDRVLATDLRAVAVLTNAAASHLIKTKGNIINVSSVASTLASPNFSPYSTAKAGLDHFSRCVALELAPKGVRVNSVNPGPVRTDIFTTFGLSNEEAEKMLEATSNNTPLKIVSNSEEVGNLIVYLASDKARSITGADYAIDCGVKLAGLQDMSNNYEQSTLH